MAGSELAARLPVVILGVPAVVGLAYVGGWPLGVFIAIVAGVGAKEFYSLAAVHGGRPFDGLGVTATVAIVLAAVGTPMFDVFAVRALAVVLVVTLACLALTIWRRWPGGQPISAAMATAGGVVYLGVAMSFAILLRAMPGHDGAAPAAWAGTALLFFPITVTWIGDSCAYLGGRAWGKKKLIPQVSPGKTVAGSVASFVGSMVVAGLYVQLLLEGPERPGMTLAVGAVMGLLLSAAAQIGDLVASVAKREAGVKDSGRLFPGHGGALDRLDALLFTLPLAYGMIRLAEVLS